MNEKWVKDVIDEEAKSNAEAVNTLLESCNPETAATIIAAKNHPEDLIKVSTVEEMWDLVK